LHDDGDRNCQVKPVAGFGNIGWCEIHEDSFGRILKAAVSDRNADPLTSFADLRRRKPNDVGPRYSRADIHLDRNQLTKISKRCI
jgi:hypothetical protein